MFDVKNGAGRRNRTDDLCVEGRCFTSKLYPQQQKKTKHSLSNRLVKPGISKSDISTAESKDTQNIQMPKLEIEYLLYEISVVLIVG